MDTELKNEKNYNNFLRDLQISVFLTFTSTSFMNSYESSTKYFPDTDPKVRTFIFFSFLFSSILLSISANYNLLVDHYKFFKPYDTEKKNKGCRNSNIRWRYGMYLAIGVLVTVSQFVIILHM